MLIGVILILVGLTYFPRSRWARSQKDCTEMSVTTTTPGAAPAGRRQVGRTEPRRIGGGLLDPKMLWRSTPDAFKKLDPRVQIKNPVMFVVEVGALLTLYTAISSRRSSTGPSWSGSG